MHTPTETHRHAHTCTCLLRHTITHVHTPANTHRHVHTHQQTHRRVHMPTPTQTNTHQPLLAPAAPLSRPGMSSVSLVCTVLEESGGPHYPWTPQPQSDSNPATVSSRLQVTSQDPCTLLKVAEKPLQGWCITRGLTNPVRCQSHSICPSDKPDWITKPQLSSWRCPGASSLQHRAAQRHSR